MNNLQIVKGDPRSAVGGRLNRIALDYMAYPLVGSKQGIIIEKTMKRLWHASSNRFSHQYAFEAKIGPQTLGMITCYPVSVMNRLAWPTFLQLIRYRKWSLVGHSLTHLKDLLSLVSLSEGRADEYHIGTLATLPESRGFGVGSQLIGFAEEQALQQEYTKCSLTVKKENLLAIKLYEKLGYQKEASIEKSPFSLYRMVKPLN